MENAFATRDIIEVDEFLIIYFMMVTIFNDYFTDSEEFREEFRGSMEGQFELDWYNRSFSNQVKSYENDTFDNRIAIWLLIVHRRRPIPDNVNKYHMDKKFNLWCKAPDPEMQELSKQLSMKKYCINDKYNH